MKKCLIIFTIMILSIIPISKASADYTITTKLGDVHILPDKPNDGYDNFMIFINPYGYYHMITTHSEIERFGLRGYYYVNNKKIFFPSLTDYDTDFNEYYYNSDKNSWVLNKNYSCNHCYLDLNDTAVYTVLYSSVDIVSHRHTFTSLDFSNLESGTFNDGDIVYYADTPITMQPFEELIPTSLYKGLVFSFNTSNVSSKDILSFNYNFYSSDENYNILDFTFEIPYFGYNGKDIYSDGSYTLNYQTNQLDAIPRNNYINDNFLQNFKYFESEYKLFVNFEMLEDNYLYAYLDSPLNYTVEYIEREENLYYFDEVDITGKYGVVFIPNDITNDYVSVMKFSEKGKYSVQLRDSYSETNENYNILEYYQIGFCDNLDVTGLVPVNCVDSYFLSLNNYFREKKQFVYVKNENNYDSSVKSVITYDTRYYTAYIQEYSNSNIEIFNPNTGETDVFGPMTDFDNIYYEISNDNILELMHTFLEDLQQTSDTFNYMWNNFYSIMPNILKTFLQVITHLFCILVFMKIVGYD